MVLPPVSMTFKFICTTTSYTSTPALGTCATSGSAGGGSNLVLYGSPVSIARLISSYISKITRFVRYSPYRFSSLRSLIDYEAHIFHPAGLLQWIHLDYRAKSHIGCLHIGRTHRELFDTRCYILALASPNEA